MSPKIDVTYAPSNKKGTRWITLKDYTFTLTDEKVITVPKGFEWDLSSVPRILWFLFPPYGKFIKGSLIHDYLYRVKGYRTRRFADKQMLYFSNKFNKNKLDNYIRYYSVRLFGWKNY